MRGVRRIELASRPRLLAGIGLSVLAAGFAAGLVSRGGAREVARGVSAEFGLRRVEELAPLIRAAAAEAGLDACLVAAVCFVESRGRTDAVSPKGARGLMQLMPEAASDAARALGLPPPTPQALTCDPALNLRLGARHLAWTLEHEGGDIERALVAYNAGRARLARWIGEQGGYDRWRAKQIADGDSQVLAYAWRVLEVAERLRERGVVCGGSPAGLRRGSIDSPTRSE